MEESILRSQRSTAGKRVQQYDRTGSKKDFRGETLWDILDTVEFGRRPPQPAQSAQWAGEWEARTAGLHKQLAALDKEISALKEEHVPCPDTISGLQAKAEDVAKQLYAVRKNVHEAESADSKQKAPWTLMQGTVPSHFSLVDRWIFHARALCPSYSPHKLSQVFSSAHRHGYAVIHRRQGSLVHLESKEKSNVAPLAFSVGLSVDLQTGPRHAGRRAVPVLPFEIMLYGIPHEQQERHGQHRAGLGEMMAKCVQYLEDYMATREMQGRMLPEAVATHEVLDLENGYKMLVSEDHDASGRLFCSPLALAGLFHQCHNQLCIRPRNEMGGPASPLPRLVHIYLEASG